MYFYGGRTPLQGSGTLGVIPTPAIVAAVETVTSTTYKCTETVCYSVNSPAQNTAFINFQKALNSVGGSAGFSKIKTDGLLGSGTLAAWKKARTWAATIAPTLVPNVTTLPQIAASVTSLTLVLNAVARTGAIPVKEPAAPPQGDIDGSIPSADLEAFKKLQSSKVPYYIAAGIGGVFLVLIALKLSGEPSGIIEPEHAT